MGNIQYLQILLSHAKKFKNAILKDLSPDKMKTVVSHFYLN